MKEEKNTKNQQLPKQEGIRREKTEKQAKSSSCSHKEETELRE